MLINSPFGQIFTLNSVENETKATEFRPEETGQFTGQK